MKLSVRKRVVIAAAIGALLLTAGAVGSGAIAPAQAAQGIRTIASVCDWEDVEWSEMTGAEKRQWAALGWNQALWESDDESAYPASAFKDWEELDLGERAAAWALGYTPRSWDAEDICP